MGIAFINIENELSFQSKTGIPDKNYAPEIAFKNKPLDFQYDSTEVVSSFLAIKLDSNGQASDSINLSTSLINFTGSQHICDGLTNFSSDLEGGNYYFLVNSKYKSDNFNVVTALIEGVSNQNPIAVSGLGFVNLEYENPFRLKDGAPDLGYAKEYSENSNILSFIYEATDSVAKIDLIELDAIGQEKEPVSLSTSLISSDGSYHTSTQGSHSFSGGRFFFRVNDKYESDVFYISELENIGVGFDTIGTTLIVY